MQLVQYDLKQHQLKVLCSFCPKGKYNLVQTQYWVTDSVSTSIKRLVRTVMTVALTFPKTDMIYNHIKWINNNFCSKLEVPESIWTNEQTNHTLLVHWFVHLFVHLKSKFSTCIIYRIYSGCIWAQRNLSMHVND